jgi:hypothetical protein
MKIAPTLPHTPAPSGRSLPCTPIIGSVASESMDALAAAIVVALSVLSGLLVRRVRGLLADVSELSERVKELAARMDAAQQDVAGALVRTEVAETVLLDKGLADEDDLEAARRRFGEDAPAAPTDELH